MKKILALCLCASVVMLSACESGGDGSNYNIYDALYSGTSSSAEESSKTEVSSKEETSSEEEVSSVVKEEPFVQESSQPATESSAVESSQAESSDKSSETVSVAPSGDDLEAYADALYDVFSDYADAAEMLSDAVEWYDVELAQAAYDEAAAALDATAAITPPAEYAARHKELVNSIDLEKQFFAMSVRLCEFGTMTDYTESDEEELMQLVDDLADITNKMEYANIISDIIIEIYY